MDDLKLINSPSPEKPSQFQKLWGKKKKDPVTFYFPSKSVEWGDLKKAVEPQPLPIPIRPNFNLLVL